MAELEKRGKRDTFDELLNDVNSLLEEGECTPSEILSDPLGLDESYDLDEFNEGDDENSDFEITVVARKQRAAEDNDTPSPNKDAHSSPLHRPVSFKTPTPPRSESPRPGCSAAAVIEAPYRVPEPEVSRDSSAEGADRVSPDLRPRSSLQTVDEVLCTSSGAAAIVAAAATTSPTDATSPYSPKGSLLSESRTGLPNFTSTPISIKQPSQQQQQQPKRIAKLFQTSLELSEPSALHLLPIAEEGTEDVNNQTDVGTLDDVTLKPAADACLDAKDGGVATGNPALINPSSTDPASVKSAFSTKDANSEAKGPEEEDGYCSSVLEGYNDLRPAEKSDEELFEDNLLYGDLGGVGDDCLVHFDYTDDEFDEISRRLLGEDAADGDSLLIRESRDASPPTKRRKREPLLSPIPSRGYSSREKENVCTIDDDDDDDDDDEDVVLLDGPDRDVDDVVGDDNNNDKLVDSLNAVSTSNPPRKSFPDLVVIDEDVDENTVVDGNESDHSDVICLGRQEKAEADGDGGNEGEDVVVVTETEEEGEIKDGAAALNKSIGEVSESESVGILVEDYEEGMEAAASASASSSLQTVDKSLKRKAEPDSGVQIQERENSETTPKGPKIKRVLEVKGKYRWDIFSDSNLVKDRFDKEPSLEEINFELVCPLGGDRLTDPIRTRNCSHLRVFDRKNLFVFLNVDVGNSDCPFCGIGKVTEGGEMVIDVSQVFEEILSKTTASSATLYRDGTWDPKKGSEVDTRGGKEGVVNDKEKSIIAETILPGVSEPKVIQIYDKHGDKKTVKIENEDQMMRLVGEKWDLPAFPKRDKNRTVSNFRKKRLKKSGQVLVGRSLLERNESPLYRSNDDDDGAQPRQSRKRKRTVEQFDSDKKALVDRFVQGVLERQLELLEKEREQTKKRMKQNFDQEVTGMQFAQRSEVAAANHRLTIQGATREDMFRVGRIMRQRHDAQMAYLRSCYQKTAATFEMTYEQKRQNMEGDVKRDVARTTRLGVPDKHKENISKRGEDVEDIVPAVLCGGNEKKVKTTFLPIDCVEAILKENEAYRQVYGMDDRVLSKR